MTDNDNAAWEKAERERAQEAMKTKCPPRGDSREQPFVAGWMVKAREDKTQLAFMQDATSDPEFARVATRANVELETKLHEARTEITLLRNAVNAGIDNEQELKKRLATANERCAKAEVLLREMRSMMRRDAWDTIGGDALWDAWQLTLPAEQKEADRAD